MGEVIISREAYENAKRINIDETILYKIKGIDDKSLITDFNRQEEKYYRKVIENVNRSNKKEFNYSASERDCEEIITAATQLGYNVEEVGSENILGCPHFFHFTKKKDLEKEVETNY